MIAAVPSTSELRAISFDVGGTLIEPWPSVGHVYAGIAERFGITGVAPEALNRGFALAWKDRGAFDYSHEAWRELVNQSFRGLCPDSPSLECFDAMYESFASAGTWRMFDDVLPTLAAVRQRGWKLALISNWDERLRPLLRELELIEHFDVILVSHETGFTKPAPEMFHRAACELGLPVESVLHIGDSMVEDFKAARSAGMRSMLLDRNAGYGASDSVNTLAAVLGLT